MNPKLIFERIQLPLLLLITFVTRLFFIFDGYGVEEDSWGLVVNSFEMHETGHYVASRFPGHPLQEYLYSFIYDSPAWVYNSFSLLMSLIAVAFFYLALKKMQLSTAFWAALMLSFTPVFFISGTYTIDFAWSLAFVMASFYFLLDRKFLLSGIMLAMATGCRITSEVFLLPWAILLWSRLDIKTWFRNCFLVAFPAILIGFAWYIPAYLQYGKAFFDYSDQFPYPNIPKVLYKASIGVFGLTGMILLAVFSIPAISSWRKKELQPVTLFRTERMIFASIVVILLMIVSYLRLPQKSGYLVPMIPFVILLFAMTLSDKKFYFMTILFLLSPFFLSVNLTDSIRGAEHSAGAIRFNVSGQEIFIDPFTGPAQSEKSKRINKMEYCERVFKSLYDMDEKTQVICGWWYNEIYVDYLRTNHLFIKRQIPKAKLLFYSECSQLDSAISQGNKIYYLPEQNLYNDQMFGQNCTDSLAKEYPIR